jgi:ribonucleoside-diphosphate reductase subunit M2
VTSNYEVYCPKFFIRSLYFLTHKKISVEIRHKQISFKKKQTHNKNTQMASQVTVKQVDSALASYLNHDGSRKTALLLRDQLAKPQPRRRSYIPTKEEEEKEPEEQSHKAQSSTYSDSEDEELEAESDSESEEEDALEDYILTETEDRFVMGDAPRDQKIWKMAKKAEASMWPAQEVHNLSGDLKHWEKMTPKAQHFIKMILAFFAASDGIVSENLTLRFYNDVKLPEARHFYAFQNAIEHVHAEMYRLLIQTLVTDKEERRSLQSAVKNFPCIKAKADFALQHLASDCSFAERLVAFACVEGIFFSASFCAIYWAVKSGKLLALYQSNKLISRDEALHCRFAALLYRKLVTKYKLSTEKIHSIIEKAVDIELSFVRDILPDDLPDMNSESMSQYVRLAANQLCSQLRVPVIYNDTEARQPFPWLKLLTMDGAANFFETPETSYQKSGVTKTLNGKSDDIPETAFHPKEAQPNRRSLLRDLPVVRDH